MQDTGHNQYGRRVNQASPVAVLMHLDQCRRNRRRIFYEAG